MNGELQIALRTVLYVGSIAITAWVVATIALLLKVRAQLERVVRSLEELKAEMTPLARDARAAVGQLRDISGRAHERWMEVESVIDAARSWSQRAGRRWKNLGPSQRKARES